jgi:hypothetical protein
MIVNNFKNKLTEQKKKPDLSFSFEDVRTKLSFVFKLFIYF